MTSFDTCSGEGHDFCWGPVFQQVIRSDRTPAPWEQVLRAATVYQRGTPSCIWNVAAQWGPGRAERLRLFDACLAVVESAMSYSSEEQWGVYPVSLFGRCEELRVALEALKS